MRYKNINADFIDTDFLCFTSGEHEGNIVLVVNVELKLKICLMKM